MTPTPKRRIRGRRVVRIVRAHPAEDEVLAFLAIGPTTIPALVRLTGRSRVRLRTVVDRLRELGYVRLHGSVRPEGRDGRGTRSYAWALVPESERLDRHLAAAKAVLEKSGFVVTRRVA